MRSSSQISSTCCFFKEKEEAYHHLFVYYWLQPEARGHKKLFWLTVYSSTVVMSIWKLDEANNQINYFYVCGLKSEIDYISITESPEQIEAKLFRWLSGVAKVAMSWRPIDNFPLNRCFIEVTDQECVAWWHWLSAVLFQGFVMKLFVIDIDEIKLSLQHRPAQWRQIFVILLILWLVICFRNCKKGLRWFDLGRFFSSHRQDI